MNGFIEGSKHQAVNRWSGLEKDLYTLNCILVPLGVAVGDIAKEFSQREEFQVVHLAIHFLSNGT